MRYLAIMVLALILTAGGLNRDGRVPSGGQSIPPIPASTQSVSEWTGKADADWLGWPRRVLNEIGTDISDGALSGTDLTYRAQYDAIVWDMRRLMTAQAQTNLISLEATSQGAYNKDLLNLGYIRIMHAQDFPAEEHHIDYALEDSLFYTSGDLVSRYAGGAYSSNAIIYYPTSANDSVAFANVINEDMTNLGWTTREDKVVQYVDTLKLYVNGWFTTSELDGVYFDYFDRTPQRTFDGVSGWDADVDGAVDYNNSGWLQTDVKNQYYTFHQKVIGQIQRDFGEDFMIEINDLWYRHEDGPADWGVDMFMIEKFPEIDCSNDLLCFEQVEDLIAKAPTIRGAKWVILESRTSRNSQFNGWQGSADGDAVEAVRVASLLLGCFYGQQTSTLAQIQDSGYFDAGAQLGDLVKTDLGATTRWTRQYENGWARAVFTDATSAIDSLSWDAN